MNEDEKAQRLERLRAGYRRWRRAMNGETPPDELPDRELTPEEYRSIAEALAIPETKPEPPDEASG